MFFKHAVRKQKKTEKEEEGKNTHTHTHPLRLYRMMQRCYNRAKSGWARQIKAEQREERSNEEQGKVTERY